VTQKNALLSTPLRAWSLYPDMGSEVYIFIQHCFQSFSTRFLKSFNIIILPLVIWIWPQNRRSWVRIPPGCNVHMRSLYIENFRCIVIVSIRRK
jgi:hypothetical protein